jgi:hypothetical protein
MSWTCGTPLAMEVSRTPVFRGGGGGMSRDRGLYAVLVCIFRFDEVRVSGDEENDRTTCWYGRKGQATLEEANLKTKTDGAVKGTKTRCADMMKGVKMASPRSIVSDCGGERRWSAFVIQMLHTGRLGS